MASNYWDYYGWANTGLTSASGSTSWSIFPNSGDTSAASGYTRFCTVVRKYLVTPPVIWSKDQILKFVELVNYKTKTGFVVNMVIDGNVLITDPNIERREMIDFIPLLKNYASQSDIKKINEFFESNPIEIRQPASGGLTACNGKINASGYCEKCNKEAQTSSGFCTRLI